MGERAAILAVGSELLSGQVVNSNAAWVSHQLWNVGFDPVRHLTVDDIHAEIKEGLTALADVASLIVVTGGLGPTSDDLTREAVSDWCGRPLVFDVASWTHVADIFKGFQTTPPEVNRQQCYFPEGAQVLVNRAGTANGFVTEGHGCLVIVLPGPPREIQVIWEDHLTSLLAQRVPLAERRQLRMWRTIGRGESHLAELVTPVLKDRGLEVAYRAHAPYVELKLRYPQSLAAVADQVASELDQLLAPWLYERDGEDTLAALARALGRYPSVQLCDHATKGVLWDVLGPHVRDQSESQTAWIVGLGWQGGICAAGPQMEDGITLRLEGFDPRGYWTVGLEGQDLRREETRPSPYTAVALASRNLRAVAYWAAKVWLQWLTEGLQASDSSRN